MVIEACPFCGCDDPYWDEIELQEIMYFLVCPECEAEGPLGATIDAAGAKWNKRA